MRLSATLSAAIYQAILFGLLSALANGATIHVPADQPTIQAGLNAASRGDTVLVECGTYLEHDINMTPGVVLRSETGTPDCVIIDAGGAGRVVLCNELVGQTEIEGFTFTNGHASVSGGGMAVVLSDVNISDCVFDQNSCDHAGAGLDVVTSDVSVTGCVFDRNFCPHGGGAIWVRDSAWLTLEGCTFVANFSGTLGAAVNSDGAATTIDHCTFYDNWGGGLYIAHGSTSVLSNTIIAYNSQAPAVRCPYGGSVFISCCDVFGNSGGDWIDCIAGRLGQDGNIHADPLFCFPEDDDFTLHRESPCAPENSGGCGLIGALPVACGMVAVEEATWGMVKVRYR